MHYAVRRNSTGSLFHVFPTYKHTHFILLFFKLGCYYNLSVQLCVYSTQCQTFDYIQHYLKNSSSNCWTGQTNWNTRSFLNLSIMFLGKVGKYLLSRSAAVGAMCGTKGASLSSLYESNAAPQVRKRVVNIFNCWPLISVWNRGALSRLWSCSFLVLLGFGKVRLVGDTNGSRCEPR